MPDAASLFMARIDLDGQRLMRLDGATSARGSDLGYRIHSALAALFGASTVQPFRLLPDPGRRVRLLAYTSRPAEELASRALELAPPDAHSACDWRSFVTKPMPAGWIEGKSYGFSVRACPIVRLASDRSIADREGNVQELRAGTEVDAWLHRRYIAAEADPAIGRETAYGDWLARQVAGAITVHEVRMSQFQRRQLLRKTQGSERRFKALERPDAELEGSLTVTDGAAFQQLLARGVGRHRSFGFGMLLLRPG